MCLCIFLSLLYLYVNLFINRWQGAEGPSAVLARGWGNHIELLEVRWGEEGGNTRPNGFTGNDDPIQHAKGTRYMVMGDG